VAVAIALAIFPLGGLAISAAELQWVEGGWFLCAAAGAVAVGYAMRHFQRSTLRPLLLCLATAGTASVAAFLLLTAANTGHLRADPLVGLMWLLLYFPALFILEEVSFRGALDSHIYRPGGRFGWLSALAVSALWGLWHLPTLEPDQRGVGTAASLVVFHCVVGVPLSLYWRRSGNLAVPSFTHALLDAVRNALQASS
jgi:membrane protease YdiL (CAAX protease family)